jgi:hypothetical protein
VYGEPAASAKVAAFDLVRERGVEGGGDTD